MGLEHVSTDFTGINYTTVSNSTFTPLGYVSGGVGSSTMPSGGTNPSVFVPVIQQQAQVQKDDSYHFGDFTKAVLKGTGQLLGGALYCGGTALANAAVAYNMFGPRWGWGPGFWGPGPSLWGPGCWGPGFWGPGCLPPGGSVTYRYNGPLAPAPGPIHP